MIISLFSPPKIVVGKRKTGRQASRQADGRTEERKIRKREFKRRKSQNNIRIRRTQKKEKE